MAKKESSFLLIIGCVILGILAGYLIREPEIQKAKSELSVYEKDISDLRSALNSSEESKTLCEERKELVECIKDENRYSRIKCQNMLVKLFLNECSITECYAEYDVFKKKIMNESICQDPDWKTRLNIRLAELGEKIE